MFYPPYVNDIISYSCFLFISQPNANLELKFTEEYMIIQASCVLSSSLPFPSPVRRFRMKQKAFKISGCYNFAFTGLRFLWMNFS